MYIRFSQGKKFASHVKGTIISKFERQTSLCYLHIRVIAPVSIEGLLGASNMTI